MRSVVIATNNRHKLEEIQSLLAGGIQLRTLQDIGCTETLAEEQDTLEGNSRQKAEYVHRHYRVDCFADDTGLEVDALGGQPGVDSAHYAGPQRNAEDNMNLLLRNLSGKSNRQARFRTVITLFLKSQMFTFEGTVDGVILDQRRGADGFGYDPIFLPKDASKTLAEMSLEEKNAVSHRGAAVRKLVNFLNAQS